MAIIIQLPDTATSHAKPSINGDTLREVDK